MKLAVVHEGIPKSKKEHEEEVLRTFKRKTLRPGLLGQKSSATRAQEERDLIRALSEFPPQALNGFDDSFALLDGGVGVAVSAAMAKRAALYSKNDQAMVAFQLSDAPEQSQAARKSREAEPEFLKEVVNQLVKPKKKRPKGDVSKQGTKSKLPVRNRQEDGRRSTDSLDDIHLREWAKSWLQPAGISGICKDFGRFQERITHRFRCWHAGQAGNGFVPLPVLPPLPPTQISRNGNSRRLVPAKWLKPDSATSSSAHLESPMLDFLRESLDDEAEPELAHSPVSVKDMTMTSSIMSSYSSCNRSCQPHGIFREVSWEDSVGHSEKPLRLLRCPPEFQEPHRMPKCDSFTSSPEFLYLRVCELSGQLPCSEAWLHFGNGWGILDASNRSLGDGDLQALVRTAMICQTQGHPLRELNLSGNKLTDAGLQEVLSLLRQNSEGQEVAALQPDKEQSPRATSVCLESVSIAYNSHLHFRDKLLLESLPRSVACMTSLTTLDISFAPLNGKVAISLAKALGESCQTLRGLSLAGCGLGSCGQADCVAVAALLGQHSGAEVGFPGLERADLSGNFFGAAGFLAAAVAICNSRLRWLAFANNGNPPSEGSAKVELPFCRQFLRISESEIEKERESLTLNSRQNPLQLFLEGLLVNDTLEELDISNCAVGIDTAWVLQEALQRHSKLQNLRLCENPLGEAGLRHILRLLTEMGDVLTSIDLFGHREADVRCPPVKYRHAHPAGNYKLDLSLVADRAILRTLLRHVDAKSLDPPQRFLRFDPKSARPTARDRRGFWLVPSFGTCHVMYMPPLSEASHRRAKEAEADQLREADASESNSRKSMQARGSFVTRSRHLGSFDSGDDVLRSRSRVSPMSYGTGHNGSISMSFPGLLPLTKEKPQIEAKSQVQPGLPGTPEGDWIEVHELLQDCRVKVNSGRFQLIKQAFVASVTDEERFRFARALAKELWCNEGQVKNLVDSRVELETQLICLLFPCIRSRKNQLALLQQVEPAKVKKVADSVRGLLWFQDANPTGSYNLDLSMPPDYALAEACLLVNAWESEAARCAGRPDLSQSGNGEMIRNEAYNDVPFVYSKDWLLPSRGWLRFDYSSTRRPPPDASSMTEVSEITRLLRNKELCSRSRLEALRAASVHIFISSNQCRALVQCFPAALECSSPEAISCGLDESPDRQEALCILHTRVVDRERMLGPEVLYSPMVVTQIGMNHTSGAVRVRGGMFKTGDLEMKTAEVQLPPVASALDGQSQASAEERRDQNLKLAQDPTSAYFNFLIVFKEQDVLVLYRRLGVLHLLNPYKPEVLRMPVKLDIFEQHRVVDFLVQLATLETGSRVLCWLDGTQVSVPASWGDKGVPRTNALLTVSYEGHNSSFSARQALADQFCIGFWSNLQKA